MGPARLAAIPPTIDDLSTITSQAFPVPARNDSPTSDHSASCVAADLPQDFDLADALPDPVAPLQNDSTPMTSPATEQPDSGMNLLVGGALAPVPSTPSFPSHPKPNPRLQLPSFKSLGIAARHLDQVSRSSAVGTGLDGTMEHSRLASMPAEFALAAPGAMTDDAEWKSLLHLRMPPAYEVGGMPGPRFARSPSTSSLEPLERCSRIDSGSSSEAVNDAMPESFACTKAHRAGDDAPVKSLRRTMTDPLGIQLRPLDVVDIPGHANGSFADFVPGAYDMRDSQSPFPAHTMPLTPPVEHNDHDWEATLPAYHNTASLFGCDAIEALSLNTTSDTPHDDHEGVSPTAAGQVAESSDTDFHTTPLASFTVANSIVDPWAFTDLINDKLNDAVNPPTAADPTNVSCQTLPSPLSNNRHSPLYVRILGELQDATPQDNGAAIRVWYLIRKGVSCGDGPVSPPATPRSMTSAEDYFTPKVYDFLARTPDYQNDQPAFHGTPNNVLPLASINISVLERYVPPASPTECRQLFNTQGLSPLVDRLTELSPNNGCLVFVYPTRRGATDFMEHYLDPLLGPILRSTMLVNNLPCDLGANIDTMSAISELYDHASLQEQMDGLCSRLSHVSTATQRFHGIKACFDVIYNATHRVQLGRDCWADWWTKQEKARVKDVVTRHLQAAAASKRPHNDYGQRLANATELSQQIMTAVETREYAAGAEPIQGVEVGVFVVQRSA